MKRSRFISAALVVVILSSIFGSGLSIGAGAAPVTRDSDGDIYFRTPPVSRVEYTHNYPDGWPGTRSVPVNNPNPFSTAVDFHAPRGVMGHTYPHPSPGFEAVSEGWVYNGELLGSISRRSRNATAQPWQVGQPLPSPVNGVPGNLNAPLEGPNGRGVFDFRGWNSLQNGNGAVIDGNTRIVSDTLLFAQWWPMREVGIRHVFNGGPGPGDSHFNAWELDEYIPARPPGARGMDVGEVIDLAYYTTNLHLSFVGFNFYTFQGWRVAVGTPDNLRANHLDSSFNQSVFAQSITVPDPYNFRTFELGRLYLIAYWRVTPPDSSVWIPPPPGSDTGGGGGGGAGGGQQTSPPGGGVIGGAPGVPVGPGAEPPADELPPYYTSVPETGGAPLLPIITTFPTPPAVVPMPSLPAPFTPVPLPEVPGIIEIPAIAVPIIGLDSNTWALMNLILAIVGAAGAVAAVGYVWLKNKRREEGIDWEDKEEAQKRRRQWLMVVGIVSLVSVVLFPLTQDMSRRMTLFDIWTIAHVILLVAQGVAVWHILGRRKEKEDEEYARA